MFFDIIKFYKNSDQINITDQKLTLGEYLENNKLSKTFIELPYYPDGICNLVYASL